MKKGFLVIAVLVLAGIPGMLFFNGILMERTVQKGFQDINQMYSQTGSDLKLAIVEYDRGLFDTRFEWKIDFGSLEPVYGIKDIRFVETASHGFLGITSETSLEKNLWFTDWVNTHLNGKNPLKIQTRYAVSGPIVSTISLDEFSITPPQVPPPSVSRVLT
ncbi:MAG: DUF945 family protein [Desulfobacter sp.]|nr:MAG: DUF945 family protein [Desulfobacter sp.]